MTSGTRRVAQADLPTRYGAFEMFVYNAADHKEHVAPDYSGRVVVAGRSAEKAAQLAAELGHGVRSPGSTSVTSVQWRLLSRAWA